MKIKTVAFDDEFVAEFQRLPVVLQRRVEKAHLLFLENPFHPSLRLHKLTGRLKEFWSIWVNRQYRIMIDIQKDGNALFVSVGTHAIYDD